MPGIPLLSLPLSVFGGDGSLLLLLSLGWRGYNRGGGEVQF